MNIKLSVYTNRTKGLSGYGIMISGGFKETYVGKTTSDNIKEDVLVSLSKGLRACRNIVSHDDILYIEIQNQHLCNWLNGNLEYKGYSSGLDEAFNALESLDCRYRFLFIKNPVVCRIVNDGVKEVRGQSAMDAIADLL